MKPDLIITSDIHIRDDKPIARIDDFQEARNRKIQFLKETQSKYDNIPIIDSGDLLDKHKIPPHLETWCIKNLPNIVTIPGNHDLENKTIKLYHKSSLAVLEAAGTIEVLKNNITSFPSVNNFNDAIVIVGYPWGEEIKEYPIKSYRTIALCHYLVYENDNIFPNFQCERGVDFLKKMKDFDLVVTGHNHIPFTVEHEGRILVNPGSMMRMFADQMDMKPRFYLYYAEENKVEPVFYPIEEGTKVLTRKHLDVKKEKEGRFTAYVEAMNESAEIKLSFTDNMTSHLDNNFAIKPVKEFIWECINEG